MTAGLFLSGIIFCFILIPIFIASKAVREFIVLQERKPKAQPELRCGWLTQSDNA